MPRQHRSPDGVWRDCNPEVTGVCKYGDGAPHADTPQEREAVDAELAAAEGFGSGLSRSSGAKPLSVQSPAEVDTQAAEAYDQYVAARENLARTEEAIQHVNALIYGAKKARSQSYIEEARENLPKLENRRSTQQLLIDDALEEY